jgi:chitinase
MMFLSLLIFSALAPAHAATFGAYFANWAQYHAGEYKYTADKVRPIAGKLDDILYSFIYFCPPAGTSPMPYWAKAPYGHCDDSTEYQLLSVEPKDTSFIPALKGMGPKLLLSIGGWNFPSAYFSAMVASSAARTKFISSVKSWLSQHNADGVDIDWEYPCSEKRTDSVKITCELFRTVEDAGGKCPQDTDNFPIFLAEMRQALGSKLITVASQASIVHADQMNLVKSTPSVDYWNVMSYDYTVSDVTGEGGKNFNANCPLYTPTGSGVTAMSVNYTIAHYLKVGVDKSKIRVGMPYYGHTWFAPSKSGDDWKTWGGEAKVQGECCGPFKATYGGKFGKGCQQCGTMMYSEMQAAKPQDQYYDPVTKSDIAYWSSAGADSHTEKGIWLSYNSVESVKTITQYALDQGLAGVFIFDTSMDSMSGGQFTYELSNAIAGVLGK